MMNTLNEQTLMPRDWLHRRLARLVNHTGRRGSPMRGTVTLSDISKWFGVSPTILHQMEQKRLTINDKWQVQLSQFFYLLDMGLIELRVDVKKHRKHWVRLTNPNPAPCKPSLPRIDFVTTKLRFD